MLRQHNYPQTTLKDEAILMGKRTRLYLLKTIDLLENGYYDEEPLPKFTTYVVRQSNLASRNYV